MTTLLGLIYVLIPFVLAGFLLWRWPGCRRVRWVSVAGYLVMLSLLLGGALAFVAYVATARVPTLEVAIVVWFAVIWRLLWETWRRTVGRWGQRWVRWGRLSKYKRKRVPASIRLIVPARIMMTALLFFPVMLSCILTHRVKLVDGQTPESIFQVEYQSIRIPTADDLELDGWWIPKPQATRTIIIAHGAGANKGNFVWFYAGLNHEAYNLLMFDFRGHGSSDGRITTWGILERRDVLACVNWLKLEKPAQAQQIIGLGSSQGSMAVALAAADDERIDAIILDSPFVSARELAHHHASVIPVLGPAMVDWVLLLMSLQVEEDFFTHSAEHAVASLGDRSVLVIHGEKDFAMPPSHAQRLYDAVQGPRNVWYAPGSHSNIVTTTPQDYTDRVFTFLNTHLPYE